MEDSINFNTYSPVMNKKYKKIDKNQPNTIQTNSVIVEKLERKIKKEKMSLFVETRDSIFLFQLNSMICLTNIFKSRQSMFRNFSVHC